MRSGITRRWLRGNLLITVLVVLLAEAMFLYSYTRSYYGSVQQIMYRRFSSVTGQLKMYTGDTAQSAAVSRRLALRRMVEQFADKDKYEFMLLDSYGSVIASSSGTDAEGIGSSRDFEQALGAPDGLGVAVYRTQSGEMVMAACSLVPYDAEDVAALRLVTSLALVERQVKNAVIVSGFIAVAILLFTVLPTFLVGGEDHFVALGRWGKVVLEAVLKVAIFLTYMVGSSKMKEIHRVFEYHGAEHNTIFCYENEEELTVENVRKQIRFHPRCGTSFMVLMLIVGIVIGLFIPVAPFGIGFLRPVFKILLLPVSCGIGYELIKICGKHDNAFTRIIAAPGLWAQRITTKEPDDKMIEVAIEAMKAVIPDDGTDIINNK